MVQTAVYLFKVELWLCQERSNQNRLSAAAEPAGKAAAAEPAAKAAAAEPTAKAAAAQPKSNTEPELATAKESEPSSAPPPTKAKVEAASPHVAPAATELEAISASSSIGGKGPKSPVKTSKTPAPKTGYDDDAESDDLIAALLNNRPKTAGAASGSAGALPGTEPALPASGSVGEAAKPESGFLGKKNGDSSRGGATPPAKKSKSIPAKESAASAFDYSYDARKSSKPSALESAAGTTANYATTVTQRGSNPSWAGNPLVQGIFVILQLVIVYHVSRLLCCPGGARNETLSYFSASLGLPPGPQPEQVGKPETYNAGSGGVGAWGKDTRATSSSEGESKIKTPANANWHTNKMRDPLPGAPRMEAMGSFSSARTESDRIRDQFGKSVGSNGNGGSASSTGGSNAVPVTPAPAVDFGAISFAAFEDEDIEDAWARVKEDGSNSEDNWNAFADTQRE
eukprot:g18983.t1